MLPGIEEGKLVGETPRNIAPEKRNPFEHHPQIRSDPDEPEYNLAGRLILPRNPMVRILDEARQFDFENLTSRVLRVAEETRRLVDHHKRLATAREEIGRSNMRLKLANEDLRQDLARKDELIRKMQESHAAELRKVREEAAASVSKEVLEECKAKIDIAVEVMEEGRQRDKDKVEQLRARVKKARRSVKELREQLDSCRREKVSLRGRIGVLTAEKDKIRDEKESFANKVISLQAHLDQMEEFKDTVIRCSRIRIIVFGKLGLAWMCDYPQVMAGIHKRV